MRLTTETVQGASLAFQGIDDIHGRDRLALGVLGVGDSVTDNVLQEHFENASGLLVDQTADTLHSTTARQATDSGLGYPLDIITQNFSVPLSTALTKALATLSSASHLGDLDISIQDQDPKFDPGALEINDS